MGPGRSYSVFGLIINGLKIEYDARYNRLNDAFLNFEDGKMFFADINESSFS